MKIGRKKKRKGVYDAVRLPKITPNSKCRLRLLRQLRVKDYLLMEEEFIKNQERLKPQDEKKEEERTVVDAIRGTPMLVGSLEEIIDENHARQNNDLSMWARYQIIVNLGRQS